MSESLNWAAVERRALQMSDAELNYAARDAAEAASALDGAEGLSGKDSGYYRDEASVYRRELARRYAHGRAK